MAYLVAGKILRNTEIKFEVAESKSSLLLKNKWMSKNTNVSSYRELIIIRQSKSLRFKTENYLQKQAADFIRLRDVLEKGEKSKKFTSHNSI